MPGPPPELRRGLGLNNRPSGKRGERLARRFLEERGYTVVDQNYRTRHGELDLVASKDGTLVVVEVKLRRGTGFGDPLEAITLRKQRTIRAITEEYLLEKSPTFHTLRFDAIGILARSDGVRISHVTDAF
ncbi:YraN family protein [Rubrobacter tropicus]|uniref:UPF0102 protein GBA63_10065 n=1 Tax=Rubrobacter tropicus TaxID=2653851 RepID=A0A6G8Q904_9ACTN|nr:YraN family protein [Rubrobacter tropicus]QIN82956.1 YraN family protein [Rubrobacter tropicus]